MRHPEWIRVKFSGMHDTKKILRRYDVSTVCEEAKCPNQGRCFSRNTATFMILGDRCTRNCSFCAVESSKPSPPDPDEPYRVAEAACALGLNFVVITSVTRDDLSDGGAGQFADTISAIRKINNTVKIEALTPDFKGNYKDLLTVLEAQPDVFNHNVETVPRLYSKVRPSADYAISIGILKKAKTTHPNIMTKSGIMLGLGEKEEEVIAVMNDLVDVECDFLTIGQYLRPRRSNMPVVEYIRPEIFEEYKTRGIKMGFKAVAASPLTRSSMDAHEMIF